MSRISMASGIGVGALLGLAVGIGVYTFVYARGTSYMTSDPEACRNCHVMNEQFDGWVKSSHRAVAGCNDCHTPPGTVGKFATKAMNGFWHSFFFTTGGFPDPVRITGRNRAVMEKACRHCHEEIVAAIDAGHPAGDGVTCVDCHTSVGHLH